MAFEMLATIGVFAVAGHFLDKKIPFEFPIATIVLTMLGLGVAFYRILKEQPKS
jgi:F0F1-type ATP synthase assembly protein I